MKTRKWLAIFIVLAALTTGHARTLYVSTNGTNNTTGYYPDWPGAATNILWAVNMATNGETVLVTNGTYVLTNQISISQGIILRSFNNGSVDPTNTVIDGNYPNALVRCLYVYVAGATATVDGFTFTRGYQQVNAWPTDYGGGVHVRGGGLTNCIITGCINTNGVTTPRGGGAYVGAGGALRNSRIMNNTSYRSGGGVYIEDGGQVSGCDILANYATNWTGGGVYITSGTIRDCRILYNTNNYAGVGGLLMTGVSCTGMDLTISSNIGGSRGGVAMDSGLLLRCTVIGNYPGGISCSGNSRVEWCTSSCHTGVLSSFYGLGIYCAGPNDSIGNCVIQSNVATGAYGNGVYLQQNCVISNCLISGNAGNIAGGGIRMGFNTAYTNVQILSCTIVSNSTGIYFVGATNCAVVNSIVISNTAYDIGWSLAMITNAITYTCTTAITNPAAGIINASPRFVDFAGGNYRLTAASPCINAGTNQAWMTGTVDLDGRRRLDRFNGRVDMGCYEFLPQGTLFSIR